MDATDGDRSKNFTDDIDVAGDTSTSLSLEEAIVLEYYYIILLNISSKICTTKLKSKRVNIMSQQIVKCQQ